MNRILLMTSAMCLMAANVSAFEFNPYVAAKAKYMLARNEIEVTGVNEGKGKLNDNIWGASIAAGTTYPVSTGNFRFELEYTKNADAKKHDAKVKTQAALFNVYFDLNMEGQLPITPYAGIGLGWGRTEISGVSARVDEKEDAAAMQIGAGISYRMCEHTVFDLGYRYITYGDFDKEYRIPGITYEKFEYKPRAHEILLGMRYEF